MPFVAERDGETVVPEEVPDDAHVTCLDCRSELRVRQTHERNGTFVARHFWHPNGGDSCSGGESETHRRLKSVVLSKLKHFFPSAEAGLERKIGGYIVDVYLIFEEPRERFGDGVVVEVQHRNTGKDTEAVTENYLKEGYSVCWIAGAELDGKDIDLSEPDWFYHSQRMEYDLSETSGNPEKHEYEIPDTIHCPDCPAPGPNEPPVMKPLEEVHEPAHQILHQCPICRVEIWWGHGYGIRVDQDNEQQPNQWYSDADQPICQSCTSEVELTEAVGVDHAYGLGDIFECPLCGEYHIEKRNRRGGGTYVERVTHEGNLTHESDQYY